MVRHICSVIKIFFVKLQDVTSKICVNASNSVSPVKGHDVAKISLLDKGCVSRVLILSECPYVADHSRKFLSVSAFGHGCF